MVLVKMRNGAVHAGVSISTVLDMLSESTAFYEIPFLSTASMSHLSGAIFPREERRTIAKISCYRDECSENLLVCPSTPQQEEPFLCRLAASPFPVFATWSRGVPETIGYVDIDHHAGASKAVQHLLEPGHRCIASVEPAPIFEHSSSGALSRALPATPGCAGRDVFAGKLQRQRCRPIR